MKIRLKDTQAIKKKKKKTLMGLGSKSNHLSLLISVQVQDLPEPQLSQRPQDHYYTCAQSSPSTRFSPFTF